MKKLIILALALSLSACAGIPKSSLGVTNETLYQVEVGLSTAAAAAVVYRRACKAGTIPASCRQVVIKIAGYSRQARTILPRLRKFVRDGDQTNALALLLELNGVINELRSATGG